MRLAVRKDARCPGSKPFGVVDVDTSRLLRSEPTFARAQKARDRIESDHSPKPADNARYVNLVTKAALAEHRAGHLLDHTGIEQTLDTATEDQVRAAFMDAIARLELSTEGRDVIAGLYGNDAQAAFDGLNWDGWTDALGRMKGRLVERAQAAMQSAVIAIEPGFAATFGGTMAKAGDRVASGVGEHIVGIDERTRLAVKETIGDGLRNGTSIPDLTKQLSNVIGLTPGDARALDRFEKNLIGQGVDPGQIRLLVTSQRDRYLTGRAQSVARTETLWASNQGRLDGFRYAAVSGAVGADAKKQWVVAGGCCDECEAIDGEEVGLEDDFSSGDDAPPAHPNCRCTTILSDFGTVPDDAHAEQTLADEENQS